MSTWLNRLLDKVIPYRAECAYWRKRFDLMVTQGYGWKRQRDGLAEIVKTQHETIEKLTK